MAICCGPGSGMGCERARLPRRYCSRAGQWNLWQIRAVNSAITPPPDSTDKVMPRTELRVSAARDSAMSPTAQLGSHLQKAYCKILRMGLATGRSPKKTGDTSANTMPAAVIAAL